MHFRRTPSFRRHRLLIALPLVAVVVAFSVREAWGDAQPAAIVSGQVIIQRQQELFAARAAHIPFHVDTGIAGTLSASASVEATEEGIVLADGNAFIAHRGVFIVDTPNAKLYGWNGGMDVTVQNGKLTVAALTTPVLVRDDGRQFLVPLGVQWTGSDVPGEDPVWLAGLFKPLPDQYRRDRLQLLNALFSDDTQSDLAALTQPDAWLVASCHPLLREHAWTAMPDGLADHANILTAVTAFPWCDMLPEAALPLSRERWAEQFSAVLLKNDEVPLFLSGLLPDMRSALERFSRDGYPLRRNAYADSVVSLIQPYGELLSAEMQRAVQDIMHAKPPPLAPVSDVQESSMASSSASSSMSSSRDADADIAVTIRTLESIGGMRTRATAFRATEDGAVRVTELILPTPSGDLPFTFTYDVENAMVRDIWRENQELPYALNLEQFA